MYNVYSSPGFECCRGGDVCGTHRMRRFHTAVLDVAISPIVIWILSQRRIQSGVGPTVESLWLKSKDWIALKWQILWETNKFQVSFCSQFKFVRRFFVEKKKRATANNKGADQPARTRWLICAFVVRTYIKAGFLSDSRHRSSTSCTTFVWTALQWRTNIHTLKHWVYFCARMNTKLNSSQSHFL